MPKGPKGEKRPAEVIGRIARSTLIRSRLDVRPSAMFGPGDALFGTLAELARLLPILPLYSQSLWKT